MENEDNLETVEEQPLTSNRAEVEQDLAETTDASIFGPISINSLTNQNLIEAIKKQWMRHGLDRRLTIGMNWTAL
ncbi:9014_t:CDS:2 [Cetraspora pellucida]|uniref:9014_t:CDS:1 n=1 Tax=Cetraspora pellucida TaxID=1433469 RepID=A0ACA9P645_9GLOM|nr:9014_t:CDS:2 [Cetraspora pellucida]